METIHTHQLEIAQWFLFQGTPRSLESFGNGHINDTFLFVTEIKGIEKHYILQRINQTVFTRPVEVMENIVGITDYLSSFVPTLTDGKRRIIRRIIPARSGKPYYIDAGGDLWRMFDCVKDAVCYDFPDTTLLFEQSARAFGDFFMLLADYPATTLHETIRDFHNTPARLAQLESAISRDPLDRVSAVQPEIDFVMARREDIPKLVTLQASGILPTRVTHNDTKLNNVLFDSVTGDGVCVIDLDTVMPGLAAYDFGDAVRFGANTAAEDERDLSLCHFSLDMYRAYVKGFLACAGSKLTKVEIETLPLGAKLMTLECGMRFLTDHINGDTYFKIHRENQNLDRCRTQFKLVADMEAHWDEMLAIIQEMA